LTNLKSGGRQTASETQTQAESVEAVVRERDRLLEEDGEGPCVKECNCCICDPENSGRLFCTRFFRFLSLGDMCDAQLVMTPEGDVDPHDPDFVEQYM
jgi:hypothetical protein